MYNIFFQIGELFKICKFIYSKWKMDIYVLGSFISNKGIEFICEKYLQIDRVSNLIKFKMF